MLRVQGTTLVHGLGKAQHAQALRAASTLSRSRAAPQIEIFDIFDAPARMIREDAPSFASVARTYLPSPFRPRSASQASASASTVFMAGTTSAPLAGTRALSTLASSPRPHAHTAGPHVIFFSGPARPRRPPFQPSARYERNASTRAGSDTYVPHAPEVFAGPARPRRRLPVAAKKSDLPLNSKSSAWLVALVGLFGVGAYQTYDAPQIKSVQSSVPNNIFSFSRERESVGASAQRPALLKLDILRDEILPIVF
ncbi:hypothetical protein DFH11DRAFT_1744749 [Phellopilus nigrolimitatus]|nr:hypothetical protein DFH11DRAFT_1744749 [Phellopilus nigrolimitatus]